MLFQVHTHFKIFSAIQHNQNRHTNKTQTNIIFDGFIWISFSPSSCSVLVAVFNLSRFWAYFCSLIRVSSQCKKYLIASRTVHCILLLLFSSRCCFYFSFNSISNSLNSLKCWRILNFLSMPLDLVAIIELMRLKFIEMTLFSMAVRIILTRSSLNFTHLSPNFIHFNLNFIHLSLLFSWA